MLSGRTNEDQCLPAISSQREPLSPEEEVQLEWLFCLASSLERIHCRLADEFEPEQAHVGALLLTTYNPLLKPAAAVFLAS